MKNIILITLLSLTSPFWRVSNVLAQNLVPNPSFEDTIQCPQFYGDIDAACEYWSIFKGTPDYMHNCNPIIAANLAGSKQPHTGNAYAGFLTYGITTPNTLREHIGVELTSPLIIGETYFVSFFVSMVYTPHQLNIATNNIGALFTTYSYYDLLTAFPNLNYSHINDSSIISETENWVKISGSFVADSAYTYMVIGNFYDDVYTDTLNLPFTVAQQRAYYCVDDVCVSTDSLLCANFSVSVEENSLEHQFSFYPNPATDFVTVQNSFNAPFNITVFNVLGQELYSKQNITSNNLQLDVNSYNAGLFFIQINSQNKQINYKFLKQ